MMASFSTSPRAESLEQIRATPADSILSRLANPGLILPMHPLDVLETCRAERTHDERTSRSSAGRPSRARSRRLERVCKLTRSRGIERGASRRGRARLRRPTARQEHAGDLSPAATLRTKASSSRGFSKAEGRAPPLGALPSSPPADASPLRVAGPPVCHGGVCRRRMRGEARRRSTSALPTFPKPEGGS